MESYGFVTLDVFADRAFAGNQLAVFPDAAGVPAEAMPAIAREFRFSETVFVLPPEEGGDARVRIFTPDGEAAFAGHPLVGAGVVLAERLGRDDLLLEVPAGACSVHVEDAPGGLRAASVATPQAFAVETEVPVAALAAALELPPEAVLVGTHPPTSCGLGRAFVVAEVAPGALSAARPDAAAFRQARADLGLDRFAVLAWAQGSAGPVEMRMFSPLTGTVEDAATGSAGVALAALLLHHAPDRAELRLVAHQGAALGRPSELRLHAWRDGASLRASVGGAVVPVTSGVLTF